MRVAPEIVLTSEEHAELAKLVGSAQRRMEEGKVSGKICVRVNS